MSLRQPRPTTPPPPAERPAVDEWGIYDPSQAGLEALMNRLDVERRNNAGRDAPQLTPTLRDANRLAAALRRDVANQKRK